MSAYNTLATTARCPNCGAEVEVEIQFRYGDTWQHVYRVGDVLRWGGNDVGLPSQTRVLVEGIAGPCPNCGTPNMEYDIPVERDVIRAVEAVGTERRNPSAEGYTVVAPHAEPAG